MLATPNKAMQFWAEMRSTAYLFSKSSSPTSEQAGRLINQLQDILGKRITTYPQVFREFGIGPNTPYHLKKVFLGLDKSPCSQETNINEIKFLQFMSQKASEAQKGNWSWRITQEAEAKQTEGWYPFFVTLTVDPKRCDGTLYDSPRDLWEKGREFRKYIRRLANVAAKELGHPPPHKKTKDWDYRPESDYITYAGVVEHGKSQQHHHAHIMVWLKAIPSAWKIDPNQARMPGNRTERECKYMRQYWPWSIATQCPALYFRSKGDIWSQLGHVTPLDKKTGKPIKINQVQAVGAYITKYMQKGTKLWHHRMKCTRNLGMKKLQTIINRMTIDQLEPLTWRPEHSSQLRSASLIHSVPQGIVRYKATQRIFAIRYLSGSLDLKTLMLTNYEHYKKMLQSVKDGARPDRMPSADFYDWVQQFLPETKGYCEKRLLDSHRLLAYDFPRTIYRVQPTVIGGNEIGSTQCI